MGYENEELMDMRRQDESEEDGEGPQEEKIAYDGAQWWNYIP